MKTVFLIFSVFAFAVSPITASGQVNSGSNGSDGAFNPTQDVTIGMANHPDGIFQFTSVNIPQGVTVTFAPNANNTSVTWLVQNNCVISGSVMLNGANSGNGQLTGMPGGPGGFRGGHAAQNDSIPGENGLGPGGGIAGTFSSGSTWGGNGSFGAQGGLGQDGNPPYFYQQPPGTAYGNLYLLPLNGGSGGGGGFCYRSGCGGAGGGGAILIAANGSIEINGTISADGGGRSSQSDAGGGGGGSGGAIRLVASQVSGGGTLTAVGGWANFFFGDHWTGSQGGSGRIRIDSFDNNFGGSRNGVFSQGFQPIIIPAPGQGVQLHIQSVAANSVSTNPNGVLANPDVIVPAQQSNPIPIVVQCTNVPLNSEVTVTVHPVNGSDVKAVGLNNSGNQSSSTATVSLNLPRGGGIIYASVVTGLNGGNASAGSAKKAESYAKTGLTANGERFAKVEVKTQFGGKQRVAYITESGKRYEAPN